MDFELFMKGNALPVEDKEIAISKRFLDADGKPALWKLRAVTTDEDDDLRKTYTKMVPAPGKMGKRGSMIPRLDANAYSVALMTASVIYPDLNNAALQDSYGAKDAAALLRRMLTPGELTDLQAAVNDICGFQTFDELVDDAKN